MRVKRVLDEHVLAMPRTMLRYAIEKLPPAERKAIFLLNNGGYVVWFINMTHPELSD
jgi:hypothetical protein